MKICCWKIKVNCLNFLVFSLISTCSGAAYADITVKPTGNVFYRNMNQQDCPSSQKVYVGQKLLIGQGICVSKKAKATVICDNKRRPQEVLEGEKKSIAEICKRPPDPQQGDRTAIRIGGIDETIPYIISPRYTLLKNQCPTLRWHAVRGVTSYSVKLYKFESGVRNDTPVWSRTVSLDSNSGSEAEKLAYPNCDQSPLLLGSDYELVVDTNGGSSSEKEAIIPNEYRADLRGVRELRFRLIDQDDHNQLEKNTESLKTAQDIITLAIFYAENSLYSEAIEQLETLTSQGSQEPSTYRILGDLYAQSGLNRLARKAYLDARSKAKSQNNIQEQELAESALKNLCLKVNKVNKTFCKS